jgi:choice-of-anchor A domain-containing protein
MSAALPAGLSLASSSPGASAGPSWSLPMAAGEERVIVLQFTATGGEGSYTVPFTSGSVTETLAIDVAPLSGGTHAAVVQALNGLSLSGAEATARNAAVALVNQSSSTLASYPEGALYYLLDARKEVAKIANAGGADEQLARLHVATGSSTCQQMAACLRPGSGTQPAFGSYHVLVFGSASISNGSVEGSLGIGGSASLSSEGIATRWMGDAARLIVGGSVSYSSGSVGINGTGIIRASGTLTLTPSVGRRSATGSVPTENWSALATYYRDLSTRLGALPGIAAVSGPTGTYTLRGTDPARNVFTLTAAQATATRTLVFDVPLTSSVIVNVTGGAASFANGQQFVMVGGTQTPMSQHEFASRVLYNFPQASALGASSWSFQGTVLAPRASLSYANSNLFGQLIINTLSSSGVGFQQCGAYVGTLP